MDIIRCDGCGEEIDDERHWKVKEIGYDTRHYCRGCIKKILIIFT